MRHYKTDVIDPNLLTKITGEGKELKEYMGTLTYDEAVEEAGDLYEVFRTLLSVKGISVEHAREAAEEKRQSRGGFKAGIVLKSVRE